MEFHHGCNRIETGVHFQGNPLYIIELLILLLLGNTLFLFPPETKHGHCQCNSYTELTEAGVIHIHILITSFQSGTSLEVYYYQPLSCDLNWLPSQTTPRSHCRGSGSLPEIVTRSVTLYTDTVFS